MRVVYDDSKLEAKSLQPKTARDFKCCRTNNKGLLLQSPYGIIPLMGCDMKKAREKNNQRMDRIRAVQKEVFLKSYAKHGVIGPAADNAGVARSNIAAWKNNDEEFAKACENAFQEAVDLAELELRKRGVEGFDEPVLYKGEPVWKRDPHTGDLLLDEDFMPIPFTIPRKSDRLLEVYLRSHRTIYKERTEVAITNPDGSAMAPTRRVEYVLPPGMTVDDYDQKTLPDGSEFDKAPIEHKPEPEAPMHEPLEDEDFLK